MQIRSMLYHLVIAESACLFGTREIASLSSAMAAVAQLYTSFPGRNLAGLTDMVDIKPHPLYLFPFEKP